MLNKDYYNNIPSRNILNDYKPKNLSNSVDDDTTTDFIENMLINSHLDDENVIK